MFVFYEILTPFPIITCSGQSKSHKKLGTRPPRYLPRPILIPINFNSFVGLFFYLQSYRPRSNSKLSGPIMNSRFVNTFRTRPPRDLPRPILFPIDFHWILYKNLNVLKWELEHRYNTDSHLSVKKYSPPLPLGSYIQLRGPYFLKDWRYLHGFNSK